MKLLHKRESLGQCIALMAMMAAINIIVSVVAAFSIVASVFLILFLPLTSTIVVLTCKEKYFPIYAFASIGLSLVATLWNLDVTLFYVVPAILSGFIFGFFIKRSIYFGWSIVIASLVQTGISFAIVPLMNVLFEIDFIRDLQVLFKISEAIPGQIFIVVIFYLVALIQTFLSFFVVRSEVEKITNITNNKKGLKCFSFTGLCLALISAPLAFLSIAAGYGVELVSLTIAGFVIYENFINHELKQLVVSLITLIVNIFVLAIFYEMIPQYCGLFIFVLTPLVVCAVSFCFFLLKKEQHDIK